MNISWIKSEKDKDSFNMVKTLGFHVIELDDLDKTDETIKELIEDECKTIIMSSEVAGFSEDIMKKYYVAKDINIIIAPSKE